MSKELREELRKEFEKETGTPWENSQGEPDIEYVQWLEEKLIHRQESKQLTVKHIHEILMNDSYNMSDSAAYFAAEDVHSALPPMLTVEEIETILVPWTQEPLRREAAKDIHNAIYGRNE